MNFGMPLIRYRTGDVVEITDERGCVCGRSFNIVESIEGRLDDMVRLKNGRMIGRIDHIFKGLENIIEAQVIQETLDNIVIRLVVDKSVNESTIEKVRTNAEKRFGNEVNVRTEIVPEIARTRGGKFKGVVSLLNQI